jgi:hypothetical protein
MLSSRPVGLVVAVVLVACGGSNKASTAASSTGGSGNASSASTSGSGAGASTTSGGGTTTSASNGSSGSASTSSSSSGSAGGCPVFLPTSAWNTDISGAAMDPLSATYIATIGMGSNLHPDFGSDPSYGIPYQYVDSSVTKSPVIFDGAPDESDPGPYPIPANPLIEAGSDAHLLMVQTDECVLYEIGGANMQADGWHGYAGAIWDLKINATRPAGWTSADAAGLPIYPGLVRYEDVAKGAINHAVRFTAPTTQKAYVAPASHCASSDTSSSEPPMGLRIRLAASYDISAAPPQSKIILTALKKYGMILADNGSSWFVTGAPDPAWDDSDLDYIKSVPASALEVVTTGPLDTDCP